jgi:hypothetical protein
LGADPRGGWSDRLAPSQAAVVNATTVSTTGKRLPSMEPFTTASAQRQVNNGQNAAKVPSVTRSPYAEASPKSDGYNSVSPKPARRS